jgi:hypothetical protein
MPRKLRKLKPPSDCAKSYEALWKLVDGAVLDCVKMHPEYFRSDRLTTVRASLVKRVTGSIHGFALQARGQP